MNGGDAAERLRDGLQTLAEDLQPLIEQALAEGKLQLGARLRSSKTDLENAAGDIDAAALNALFAGNPDLAKLEALTTALETNAAAIASQESNVVRIAGIASGAVRIASAAGAGNLSAAVAAIGDVAKLVR